MNFRCFTIPACLLLALLSGCGPKGAAPASSTGPSTGPSDASAKDSNTNNSGAKEAAKPDSPKSLEVEMSAEMLRRGDVQASPVTLLSATASREFAGRLSPNAERSWTVGTVSDGRVIQLLVAVGDRVKKGQILARVHSHDVHEGRSDYEKAKSDRQRALNNLDYATRNRDRLRRLLDLKAASPMQAEEADAELRRAEAALRSADAELRRTRLHLEEFLEVPAEQSVAAAGNHEHPDNLLQVRAPEAGLITEKLVAQGTLVKANEPMLRLTDTATLWMIASIPEEWLGRVRLGSAAQVSVEAFAGQSFPAKVAMVGNEMDRETRTVPVRLLLNNPGNRLLPEMYARAAFPEGETQPQLRVPQEAVHDLDGLPVVFVEITPGKFSPRPLDLGEASNGQVIVRGGLQPGERIVTKGAYVVKSQLLKARLAEE